MNEVLFLSHILLVVGFVLASLRLGQNGIISLIAMQAVLANLFVIKQINLLGFTVTCSDVFAIGSILGLNLLQERFGKEAASKAIKISFLSMVFFIAMAQIHLWYAPSSQDGSHEAFRLILGAAPRIVIASLSVYFLVQKLDVLLFGWLKQIFQGGHLPLRIAISLILTQSVDTVLFSFFGLYGLVSSLFDIIIMSFMVKCLIISCSTPLISLSKRWIRDVPV